MKHLAALFLALCGFFYSNLIFAMSAAPVGWDRVIGTGGHLAYMAPANTGSGNSRAANLIWESAVGGGAKVTIPVKVAFGAGEAAVVAKGVATGANVFAAFKAIAGGPVGIGLTALMTAPAIIDWLNQGGVRPAPNVATHGKPFEIGCAPKCVEHILQFGSISTGYRPSLSAASTAMLSMLSNPESKITFKSCASSTCIYSVQPLPIGAPYNISVNYSTRNFVGSFLPVSMDDIAPYMTDRAASAAAIQAMLDHNASIEITTPSVTGPASVSGVEIKKTTPIPKPPDTTSSRTSSGNPHGLSDNVPTVTSSSTGSRDFSVDGKSVSVPTKSTTTSTYNPTTNKTTSETVTSSDPHTVTTTTTPKTNIEYSTGTNPSTGKTVSTVTGSTVTNTVTSITNNVTNVTTTTTTTETKPETPAEEKEKEDYTFSDTPFTDIPKLYEREYPDGLVGVWNEKITAIKSAPLFTLVGQLMPSLPASGQCPAFTVPVNFGPWGEYGSLDFSPPCFVWDFGKVIIIISALLLSRRLIFGG